MRVLMFADELRLIRFYSFSRSSTITMKTKVSGRSILSHLRLV